MEQTKLANDKIFSCFATKQNQFSAPAPMFNVRNGKKEKLFINSNQQIATMDVWNMCVWMDPGTYVHIEKKYIFICALHSLQLIRFSPSLSLFWFLSNSLALLSWIERQESARIPFDNRSMNLPNSNNKKNKVYCQH